MVRKELKTCKICLKEETVADPVLIVCNCPNIWVHKSCGEQMLELTAQTNCEFCQFPYRTERYANSWLRYLLETPEELYEFCDALRRTIYVIHIWIIILALVVQLSYQCLSSSSAYISLWVYLVLALLITCFRFYVDIRIWQIYYNRIAFSLIDWRKTHYSVVLYANPDPRPQTQG
ncbi:E3 ubiquitin-protein ligase MARCHF2-like [Oppia nitens]|uniref:E3 ubiquitin-protein ligase MARCHF2-like n=1 Tax=Oppia nitens TaxID=1686743 RepID=UPI0023DAFB30|nr:E3 ubiquitin-protein ligase MARCHF2-like [Oppia nitens]